jgi:hypothetical protein
LKCLRIRVYSILAGSNHGKKYKKRKSSMSAFVRVGSTRITERIRLREGNEVARTAVLAYGRRVEQIFCDDSKSAVCIILVLWLR